MPYWNFGLLLQVAKTIHRELPLPALFFGWNSFIACPLPSGAIFGTTPASIWHQFGIAAKMLIGVPSAPELFAISRWPKATQALKATMHVADIDFLCPEEVQLIADGCQPLFVSELTPLIKKLVERGMLSCIHGMCPGSKQSCFVLAATQMGRALIAVWILRHSDGAMERLEDREYALEVAQYIADATKLVNHTAALGGCLHVSQSFSGSPRSSAIVTSLVACPESLVLKVQEAIDRAVEDAFCEFQMFKPMVH